MSALLDKIRAHAESVPVRKVEVPEWGVTLHFKPITAISRQRVRVGIDPKDEGALAVSMIQELALDADGKRLFEGGAAEKAVLMGMVDMQLIMRVMAALDEAGADPDTKNG